MPAEIIMKRKVVTKAAVAFVTAHASGEFEKNVSRRVRPTFSNHSIFVI
jgi:hypothetical protein